MKLTHFLLLLPFLIYSQNFIQIEKDLVNIRFDPDQNSEKVAQAEFGQIFLSTASTKNGYKLKSPLVKKDGFIKN